MAPPPATDRFTLIAMPAKARWDAFARDVVTGLTAPAKRLPCCYFYDQEGSALFEEICTLPEYYLTRAEAEVLREHAGEIAGQLSGPVELVELGSGNAAKTRLVIEALLARQPRLRYVPVDICRTVLEDSAPALLRSYPALEVVAVAGEYREGLRYLGGEGGGPKLVLWLGSNVGNFERGEAADFLRQVRDTLAPGDRLLVGIDLRKDRAVLEAAYDDARGVTAQFNRNLLARVNRELGGNFDLHGFRHRAVYNEAEGRVEMYLVCTRRQQVRIDRLGLVVELAEGEAIHTENSYKYSPGEIEMLARAAGLVLHRQWLDGDKRFSVNLLGR